MVVIASNRDELKEALVNKAEEIIVIDSELAENIGKFIERLSFQNDVEFKNRVNITGISLILGASFLSNIMAFGFLILGFKVLLVPEIIWLTALVISLAMKLNNLLKNNYEIIKHDEEGLFLKSKLA